MASADLLLHPVRLRIVQAFLGDRALTTAELGTELGDVPPASLYRHVSLLTKAGVLQIAAERRVRAVIERTYVLRPDAAQIQPDELAAMTGEQHLAAFMAYTAGMLADAERYLISGTADPLRDGARYRLAAMWLTDAEYTELLRDLSALFQPRLANAPSRGRRRRTVYTVVVPAPEGTGVPAEKRMSGEKMAGQTRPATAGEKPATAGEKPATAGHNTAAAGDRSRRGGRSAAKKAPASTRERRRKE